MNDFQEVDSEDAEVEILKFENFLWLQPNDHVENKIKLLACKQPQQLPHQQGWLILLDLPC